MSRLEALKGGAPGRGDGVIGAWAKVAGPFARERTAISANSKIHFRRGARFIEILHGGE
jgi:hypothetical protein